MIAYVISMSRYNVAAHNVLRCGSDLSMCKWLANHRNMYIVRVVER